MLWSAKQFGQRAQEGRAAGYAAQKEVEGDVPFPGGLFKHRAAIIGGRLRWLLIKRSLATGVAILAYHANRILRLHQASPCAGEYLMGAVSPVRNQLTFSGCSGILC